MHHVVLLRREEDTFFNKVADGSIAYCDDDIFLSSRLFKMLTLQTTPILNAVFGIIVILYGLPTSSGSHHFVTTKDLCTGQSSIL